VPNTTAKIPAISATPRIKCMFTFSLVNGQRFLRSRAVCLNVVGQDRRVGYLNGHVRQVSQAIAYGMAGK
jgi:hypothetical protein